MNEQTKQAMDQYRKSAELWTETWTEAMRTGMESWASWNEQSLKLADEFGERAGEILARQQEWAKEMSQRMQAQTREGMTQATEAMRSMNDAGQSWTREAGKAMQEQAQMAQEQVTEMMAAGAEAAANGAKSAAKSSN